MTIDEIIEIATKDMKKAPDVSRMSLAEQTCCIGIYYIYKLYYKGFIDESAGKRLKSEIVKKFEVGKFYEEIYSKAVDNRQKACVAGVELTKLLQSDVSDTECLDAALNVLNVSGLSGGVPWRRQGSNEC